MFWVTRSGSRDGRRTGVPSYHPSRFVPHPETHFLLRTQSFPPPRTFELSVSSGASPSSAVPLKGLPFWEDVGLNTTFSQINGRVWVGDQYPVRRVLGRGSVTPFCYESSSSFVSVSQEGTNKTSPPV